MSVRRSTISQAASTDGQSLIETALVVPLLLMLALNALNFGYFFFVAINLAAAPRSGVEYSIQGSSTPAGNSLPNAGPMSDSSSVGYLTNQDMTGAIHNPSTKASVQVCTQQEVTSGNPTGCVRFNGSPTYSPAPDPESPNFFLNRVDVTYSFTPLIPGTPFNIVLLAAPICTSSGGTVTCKFHRQASMRALD